MSERARCGVPAATELPSTRVRAPQIGAAGELQDVRTQFRGNTIVLCHGAFDLVHMGHLIHFEEARGLGDLLVVTITATAHREEALRLPPRKRPRAADRRAGDR